MNSISGYLERCAHATNAERNLFSEDALRIAATAGHGLSQCKEIREMHEYKTWCREFTELFGARLTAFEERRFKQFDEHKNVLEKHDISSPDEFGVVDELTVITETLRSDNINARQDFEQFIAEKGNKGTISAVIEMNKLKDEPRPWKKRAKLISMTSLVRGYEAGSLALVALNIRTVISSVWEREMLQSPVEYANNVLSEVIPGDIDSMLDAGNLALYTGISTSIASFRVIRSGMVSIALWRKSNLKIAIQQFGRDSRVIIMDEWAFSKRAFFLDILIETGKDAIFPKPKIGILTAAKISWSVSKKARQYYAEKKAIEECKKMRLDGLYVSSISELDVLGQG